MVRATGSSAVARNMQPFQPCRSTKTKNSRRDVNARKKRRANAPLQTGQFTGQFTDRRRTSTDVAAAAPQLEVQLVGTSAAKKSAVIYSLFLRYSSDLWSFFFGKVCGSCLVSLAVKNEYKSILIRLLLEKKQKNKKKLFGRQRSAPSNQQMVPFTVHTVARQSDIVARGNDGVQADDLTVRDGRLRKGTKRGASPRAAQRASCRTASIT